MSESTASSEQPLPGEEKPHELSPAIKALLEAKELYGRLFPQSLPILNAQGARGINAAQVAMDGELDGIRISAIANLLVALGVLNEDIIATEYTRLLNERIAQMNSIQVARTLRTKINGHGG